MSGENKEMATMEGLSAKEDIKSETMEREVRDAVYGEMGDGAESAIVYNPESGAKRSGKVAKLNRPLKDRVVKGDNSGAESTASEGVGESDDEDDGAPEFGYYQDVIDYLEERRKGIKLPSKEQLERDRRRQRTNSLIAGIADGASAIANIIGTTQYAPDMYDAKLNLSDKMQQRYDNIKAQHEADADNYYKYSLNIAKLKEAQDQKEYQRGRDKLTDQLRESQDARAQAKEEREDAKAEAYVRLQDARANGADVKAALDEYKKECARIDKEYREKYWGSVISRNNRSGRGSGGGGGRPKGYWVTDETGKKRFIREDRLYDEYSAVPKEYRHGHGKDGMWSSVSDYSRLPYDEDMVPPSRRGGS